MMRTVRVALVGNPNSGKSTLFNNLTGLRQHVGNFPGVTVEKREGRCTWGECELWITDLPGVYSLSAHSDDERVARDFLLHERPDLVINVLDACNLERNLYLTTQVMELNIPMVLALNMSDRAAQQGIRFDLQRLSQLLRAPIIPTVGLTRQGMPELCAAAMQPPTRAASPELPPLRYHHETEAEIARLLPWAKKLPAPLFTQVPPRWVVVKLLEGDTYVQAALEASPLAAEAQAGARRLERLFGEAPAIFFASQRYGFISGACSEAMVSTVEERHTMSDRLDELLIHRVFGLPIFLGVMYLVFALVFKISEPLTHGLEWSFAALAHWWKTPDAAGWGPAASRLFSEGIIGGVGAVLVYFPNIFLLFLGIAFLEESGYMARAAFIMDRFMHRMGLHGKSFIPLLIGFGCTVPAILATRTLESKRDRFTTIMILPLISCGARMPVYLVFIGAFFPPAWRGAVLFGIYLLGVVLAILLARLLRKTVCRGDQMPFVMELPPYRMPTMYGLFRQTWDRAWHYIKKAGSVVLGLSIILWVLASYPRIESPAPPAENDQAAALEHSYMGRMGHALEPVLRPLGFDWRIGTALLGSIAAREIFVAQMGILFAVEDAETEPQALQKALRRTYSPLTALCAMLFILISMPCLGTLAAVRAETGSWRWTLAQMAGLTTLAYVMVWIIHQAGALFS